MTYSKPTHQKTRNYLQQWTDNCNSNFFLTDTNFKHSINYYLNNKNISQELTNFADQLVAVEPLVKENHFRFNYPRLEKYDNIGNAIEQVYHHPNYASVGNAIYGSGFLSKLAKSGGLQESLAFFFLSGQIGEAGHNCPFACSAGIIRVLQKVDNVPKSKFYIEKLCEPSFDNNYTGAQFLTEIQGGSDVGQNATQATQDQEGNWRISGEKWFCSNANADLILMTARFDENATGTKGLGLFLLPKYLDNNQHNHYSILRLKEKIGTNAMASGEIAFLNAIAYPVGKLEDGFKLVMENVLHISRLCNSICTLGMARRAYSIARYYAIERIAFGTAIIHYPLVQENLAIIKAENDAGLALTMSTIQLQDQYDCKNYLNDVKTDSLLLRILANLCKYFTAVYSVEHIHHSIDVLAGNGAIETFSVLPRLFRDSIVCENWEGTHNTLRVQIARDILKFEIDKILLNYVSQELAQIKLSCTDCKLHSQIEEYLQRFATQSMADFRQSDQSIQSLVIKSLVDEMCIITAATMLLKEAIDQQNQDNCLHKLNSLQLFMRNHILKTNVVDHAYLDLIKAIVQEKGI